MAGLYVMIAGAGKVGWNLARELIEKGHEVTVVEQDRRRYLTVEQELEHAVQYGDATELWVLERAGIQRADLVVAVTGDDEDNLLICQVAKEKYLVERIIARVNNPRNLEHFKLLGIQPAVSATDLILRLIEHEVPRYGLVHLLDLPEERLEIIELVVAEGAPAAGRKVSEVALPEGALVISVLRNGSGFVPKADTVVEAGDEVLVVLDPGVEEDITAPVRRRRRPRGLTARPRGRNGSAQAALEARRAGQRLGVDVRLGRVAAQEEAAVLAALDVAAGHELPERRRHRRAAGADHPRERPVRQPQPDEHAAGHHAAPALGQAPQQREQPLVDARQVRDRLHHDEPLGPAGGALDEAGEHLRPLRRAQCEPLVDDRERAPA